MATEHVAIGVNNKKLLVTQVRNLFCQVIYKYIIHLYLYEQNIKISENFKKYNNWHK